MALDPVTADVSLLSERQKPYQHFPAGAIVCLREAFAAAKSGKTTPLILVPRILLNFNLTSQS